MNKIYTIIFAALLLAAPVLAQETPDSPQHAPQLTCEELQAMYSYPSYYCDCDAATRIKTVKMDTIISDTIWYKASVNVFAEGCFAYMFSESAADMIIMLNCQNIEGDKTYRRYRVESNQSMEISKEDIQAKLKEAGISGSQSVKLCIAPAVEGIQSRFICTPADGGLSSTCEDLFPIVPEMIIATANSSDVYEFNPASFNANKGVKVEWFHTQTPCMLKITRGACNGSAVVNTMIMPDATYELDEQLLKEVHASQEKLYFHFNHTNGTVGRFRFVEYAVNTTPTNVENVINPMSSRLVLGTNGALYILRDGQRYTLTGQKF